MNVQFRTADIKPAHSRNASTTRLEAIIRWINRLYIEARFRADDWVKDQKIARSRRTIANLPEHIRQDLGSPALEDSISGSPVIHPRTGKRS